MLGVAARWAGVRLERASRCFRSWKSWAMKRCSTLRGTVL